MAPTRFVLARLMPQYARFDIESCATLPQSEPSVPESFWIIFAALVCVCIALYAIERTLLEILKTLRVMRLETRVNAASFLCEERPSEIPEIEPRGTGKAN